MHFSAFVVALASAAYVSGLQITGPVTGTTLSTSGNTDVTWTSVSTDPTDFELELVSADQLTKKVLVASVETSAGSYSVPNSDFDLGINFTINAISLPATNFVGGGILAQSGVFNVTSTGATTTSGVVPTTMTGLTTSTTTAVTTTSTGSAVTGTISGSSTALNPVATGGALGVFQVSGTLMALAVVAHAFML
jgi:hypothetical protein